MAVPLASASLLTRRPVWPGGWAWPSLRGSTLRQSQASSSPDVGRPAPALQPTAGDSTWTAEEQRYLRVLREAGL